MQHYDITHSGRFKRMSYETRLEGWDAFRSLEADCFQKTAASNKARDPADGQGMTRCRARKARSDAEAKIIACGGGIIETSRGLDLICNHHPAT